MNDPDRVLRALSDGSRRRILFALRDEDPLQPFSGDRDEGNRALRLHHVSLPLREETDRETTLEPIPTALEARREVLPDDNLPEPGQIC